MTERVDLAIGLQAVVLGEASAHVFMGEQNGFSFPMSVVIAPVDGEIPTPDLADPNSEIAQLYNVRYAGRLTADQAGEHLSGMQRAGRVIPPYETTGGVY